MFNKTNLSNRDHLVRWFIFIIIILCGMNCGFVASWGDLAKNEGVCINDGCNSKLFSFGSE